MKVGDLVKIRVVGLGAYMRKHHEEPAMIVETHSKRGKPLPFYRILWQGKIIEMSHSLLDPIDVSTDDK